MIFSMFMPYNKHGRWDIRSETNVRAHLDNVELRECITRSNEMPTHNSENINETYHRMQPFSLERVP